MIIILKIILIFLISQKTIVYSAFSFLDLHLLFLYLLLYYFLKLLGILENSTVKGIALPVCKNNVWPCMLIMCIHPI